MLLDLVQYIQPWICGNCNWQLVLQPVRFRFFTGPSTFVPSLHRLRACSFQLFTPLASFSYATWSSATFLASYSEPWTWWTFNKLTFSIANITDCTIWVFTGPSTKVPLFHRLRACIFKLCTPLTSFSYATWTSATFLASYSEPWTSGKFNRLLVLQPVQFGFFTGPSTIVPSLHRQKACIFKLFIPIASFSYATWSSSTFLAIYVESWICGNFY